MSKKVRNFFSLYGFFLQCLYGFLRKSSGNTAPTTIDNTSIVIVFMLLDEDKWMMMWEIELAWGIQKKKKDDRTHFNWIFGEEKYCSTVDTARTVSHVKLMLYGTMLETFDSLRKGKNFVFATNNPYRWNIGVWLRTWIEIFERGLEGKKFLEATKILMPSFEGKQMTIMAYDYTGVIATYVVPYGCTVHRPYNK